MSVQFGRWNMDGQPVDRGYLQKAKEMLVPYGPDGEGLYIKDSVGILYRAFHTTKESRKESQPLVTPSGTVICWDGRLDNRSELVRGLKNLLEADPTDVEIVAAAYEQWGTDCFAKLIGDWALAIWNPTSRSLLLAKDFVGPRHLYYSVEKDRITWSSILDPLVLLAEKSFALEEEYIAGWLSFFPATHLTPYVGIHAVQPSCFVRLEPGRKTVRKYWDFDPSKRIRYQTDSEYEERFRQVFRESVNRRLRSDSPILAELSGGMDSSSMVCMADGLIASGAAETPRLDTLSYYNDSEPNWDERPYFAKVEEKRNRKGCHINVGSHSTFKFEFDNARFFATPSSGGSRSDAVRLFEECLSSGRNSVVLSGIGGDEVAGGVPTPRPELAELLAKGQVRPLAHQLKAWALSKRKPWVQLLLEAADSFIPRSLVKGPRSRRVPAWLTSGFIRRNRSVLLGYEKRLQLFGPLPSFQESLSSLNALRRQLGCMAPSAKPPLEKRYPYLDRDFLEFLWAIPVDQLVRPGQRRSLMRRALVGVVPEDVLNRKRKAYVARAPVAAVSAEWQTLRKIAQYMISDSLGIIDAKRFLETMEQTRQGRQVPIVALLRTVGIELWLKHLTVVKAVDLDTTRSLVQRHPPWHMDWRTS